MKLYIWKHRGTAMRIENFYPLSKSAGSSPNTLYPVAAHAFFRKKEAKLFLDEIGWDKDVQEYYELITVEL